MKPHVRTENWPILPLLAALFVLVVIATLLPVIVLNAWSTTTILHERGMERAMAEALVSVERIEDHFGGLLSWERDFSNRPALRTWLERGDRDDPALRAHWQREVLRPFRERRQLAAAFVATPAGELLLRDGQVGVLGDLASSPSFRAAAGGAELVTDVYSDPAPYLLVMAPIRSPTGGIVGVVGVADALVGVRKIIDADAGAVGPGSFAWLADARGTPIAGQGSQIEPIDLASARTAPSLPFVRLVLATTGEPGFAAPVRLHTRPWVYLMAVPDAYVQGPVWSQVGFSAAVFAIALVLACGLSLGLARWVSRPLAHLQAAAKAWERGELGVRSGLTGTNEFGTLGQSFDEMAARLQQYNEGLEREVRERTRLLAGTLTQLQASTDRLQAQYLQLENLDRIKTRLMHAVSHDLRTPLTALRGFAELLEDEVSGPLTPSQRGYVTQIERGTERLTLLVNDLLDFAGIEAGTFRIERAPATFEPTLNETLDGLRPILAEAGLALEVEVGDGPLALEMDVRRIGQVLTNLIHNAVKFTPAGGTIRVRAWREGDSLRCEVADTGTGIAADDIPKLFKTFSQLENGARKGGTGLGLSICKSIIESHGGAIGVVSEPGEGSTFWFTLPLRSVQVG